MQHKNALIIASILLAVFLPLSIALKAEMDYKNAKIIKVEIEPYDPRDLMYGHYMQFRIKWDWKGGKANQEACTASATNMPFDAGCCLCLEGEDEKQQASLHKCGPDVPKTCNFVIPSKNYYGGDDFPIGIERFYVDERFALPLEAIFRGGKEKFFVSLAMRAKGNPILKDLYVGDLSLPEYVDKHGGSIPEELPKSDPVTP